MKPKIIKQDLQERLYEESYEDYQLKTNEEIIDIIINFGSGETEFHTEDINRIIVENQKMKKDINEIVECQNNPTKTLANLNQLINSAKEMY